MVGYRHYREPVSLMRFLKTTVCLSDFYMKVGLSLLSNWCKLPIVKVQDIWGDNLTLMWWWGCDDLIHSQTWNDFRLSWNPKDYDGIKKMRLPPSLIWKPDVKCYNTYDRPFHLYPLILLRSLLMHMLILSLNLIELSSIDKETEVMKYVQSEIER